MVFPFIRKLKKSRLEENQRNLLAVIGTNPKEISLTFALRLSLEQTGLSPAELRVAAFIRQGMRTREIASLLTVSPETVKNQRISIRKKLGLIGKCTNLEPYLISTL